ncbi:MAG: hypothetical protein FIA92_09155 [Chloroflexi bacterium]|nr:hypothetical protein [Chloroflexota bacterium]
MRTRAWFLTIAASLGAAATALVVAAMVAVGALAGDLLLGFKQLVGMGYYLGPPWLAPAVGALVIAAGGATGAWAARTGEDVLRRALLGVLVLVGGYVSWTWVWTAWRLGAEVWTYPFVPSYVTLLTLAGLLLPVTLLFVPVAVLWARLLERSLRRPG